MIITLSNVYNKKYVNENQTHNYTANQHLFYFAGNVNMEVWQTHVVIVRRCSWAGINTIPWQD